MSEEFKSTDPRFDVTKRGIVGPLLRDQKNDFVARSGFELMRANIAQALGSGRATEEGPGDVAWDGTLGSKVASLTHRNGNPARDEVLRVYVVDAVRAAVPAARITRVQLVRRGRASFINVRFVPTDGNGRDIGEESGLEVPVPEK